MKDEYGLGRPEERYEPFKAQDSPLAEEVPVVEEVEEEEIDRSGDPLYIQVRTPEYVQDTRSNVQMRNASGQLVPAVVNISTGRTLISYRRRILPEEEGLEFVEGVPPNLVQYGTTRLPLTDDADRRRDILEDKLAVDPQLLKQYLRDTADPTDDRGASGFGRWMRQFGR